MQYIKLLSIFFTLFLTNQTENKSVINIKAIGFEEGTTILVQVQNDNGVMEDYLNGKIVNQKLQLTGTTPSTLKLAILKVGSFQQSIPFVLEKGNLIIDLSLENNTKIISKLSGTNQNDKFQIYTNSSEKIIQKMIQFQEVNQEKLTKAQQEQDTKTTQELITEYNKFQEELNTNSVAFIKSNPDSYIALLLLENLTGNEIISSEETEQYMSKFSSDILKTKNAIALKNSILSKKATSIGSIAADFEAPNPEGKVISLKNSLGKVTIIDFWASWCGPCRRENPNVVAMYNELHPKGLNIIGVSLDNPNGKEKWIEAIKKDGLTWSQISNLKGWQDPIAVMYDIKSIPATLLLDKDGKIIAKNLRGEALKAKVKELLGVQ